MKRFYLIAIFIVFIIGGCQARQVQMTPALEEEGEIFVYIKPFPQEAARLRFEIEGISALMDNGTEIPLSVLLKEFKGVDIRRQRLVCSGRLLPGSYTGLLIRAKNAFIKVEDGEAALRVTDEPVRIEFPFSVKRKKALMLSMNFSYAESIKDGFSFLPSFSLWIPSKPAAGLAGYVTNSGSNNIMGFDKRSGEIFEVIATGSGPGGTVLNQRQRLAYVALSEDNAIDVIDLTAGEVINRINLQMGDKPREISLTPDGRLLLTANTGSDTVSIIDPFSFIELARVNVGRGPNFILIDRTGRKAYVFNSISSSVSVIDIANRAIADTISTDPNPLRGQFNRKGDRLYIIHEGSPYLLVIDPLSLSVLNRVFAGMGAAALKVDTRTDMLYVSKIHDAIIEVYDPFSLTPGDYIKTEGGAAYMTIDGEENNLYLVIPEKRKLIAVNLIGKKIVHEMDLAESPYIVTLMGER